jgi:Gas vesicle protein K
VIDMPATDTVTQRGQSVRLEIDADDVGRGFGRVVIAVAEILRELLERQAIRRIDAGDLDAAHIERLGAALLRVRQQLAELREAFDTSESEMSELFEPTAGLAAGTPERDDR